MNRKIVIIGMSCDGAVITQENLQSLIEDFGKISSGVAGMLNPAAIVGCGFSQNGSIVMCLDSVELTLPLVEFARVFLAAQYGTSYKFSVGIGDVCDFEGGGVVLTGPAVDFAAEVLDDCSPNITYIFNGDLKTAVDKRDLQCYSSAIEIMQFMFDSDDIDAAIDQLMDNTEESE